MLYNFATLAEMTKVKWKLGMFLKENNITAYQLGKELGGLTKLPNLYRIINGDPTRVDLNGLGEIIKALRRLTKEQVDVCDLLEYQEGEQEHE